MDFYLFFSIVFIKESWSTKQAEGWDRLCFTDEIFMMTCCPSNGHQTACVCEWNSAGISPGGATEKNRPNEHSPCFLDEIPPSFRPKKMLIEETVTLARVVPGWVRIKQERRSKKIKADRLSGSTYLSCSKMFYFCHCPLTSARQHCHHPCCLAWFWLSNCWGSLR